MTSNVSLAKTNIIKQCFEIVTIFMRPMTCVHRWIRFENSSFQFDQLKAEIFIWLRETIMSQFYSYPGMSVCYIALLYYQWTIKTNFQFREKACCSCGNSINNIIYHFKQFNSLSSCLIFCFSCLVLDHHHHRHRHHHHHWYRHMIMRPNDFKLNLIISCRWQ